MKKALLRGAALCAVLCALLIVTGCPTDDKKDDKEKDPFRGLVLTVPDITGAKIMGGSLVGDDNKPIAIGLNDGGTFEFCHPDGIMPDYTKPFSTLGEYMIGLAVVDMTQSPPKETDVYMYCGDEDTATKYNFKKLTGNTIPWNKFKKKE